MPDPACPALYPISICKMTVMRDCPSRENTCASYSSRILRLDGRPWRTQQIREREATEQQLQLPPARESVTCVAKLDDPTARSQSRWPVQSQLDCLAALARTFTSTHTLRSKVCGWNLTVIQDCEGRSETVMGKKRAVARGSSSPTHPQIAIEEVCCRSSAVCRPAGVS